MARLTEFDRNDVMALGKAEVVCEKVMESLLDEFYENVSDEEIAARQKDVNWKFDPSTCHKFLQVFTRNVTSTARGATWY